MKEMNMVAINRDAAAVYLLDDDASILKATRRLLDSAGWNNVETRSSLAEAQPWARPPRFTHPIEFLDHAEVHRPELAVIDILMPDMNRLEVQTQLRRVSPSTRVIVLSSKDDRLTRQIAMNAGAFVFFIKGVESGDFLAGVEAAADSVN
jgi:DNA-binding NarL/FixJ family response regulator